MCVPARAVDALAIAFARVTSRARRVDGHVFDHDVVGAATIASGSSAGEQPTIASATAASSVVTCGSPRPGLS